MSESHSFAVMVIIHLFEHVDLYFLVCLARPRVRAILFSWCNNSSLLPERLKQDHWPDSEEKLFGNKLGQNERR